MGFCFNKIISRLDLPETFFLKEEIYLKLYFEIEDRNLLVSVAFRAYRSYFSKKDIGLWIKLFSPV